MTDIVKLIRSGLPGEGFADLLRRTGAFGVLSTDSDAVAIGKVTADAAAAAAAAEAALNSGLSLYQSFFYPSQTIGRINPPVDGAVASNAGYALDAPVVASGVLSKFTIFPHAVGTLQIARYVRSGASAPYTFTRQAITASVAVTSDMVVAAVPVTFTPSDWGSSFPVTAGDYLAVYANGVLVYTSTATDKTSWYSLTGGLPSSVTASATTTIRLEASFEVSTQNVTGASFAALLANITSNTAVAAALAANATQVIGRAANYNIKSGNPVGGNLYTPAVPLAISNGSIFVEFWALNTNPVKLTRQTISGGVSTVVSSYTYTPTVGYNSFTLSPGTFPTNAGDYLGMSGSGTLAYGSDTPFPDDPWYLVASATTGGATGSASSANAFAIRISISGTQQTVSAASFAKVKAAAQPLIGKKIGIWGDSLSASYGLLWQTAFAARTGATMWKQDARGGRAFSAQFEAYGAPAPLASLGSMGTYSGANTAAGNVYPGSAIAISTLNKFYQVPANGTTLAQWLDDIDLLIIWLGTNDAAALTSPGSNAEYANGVGATTDGYTAKTLHAAINWVLDAALTAKPALRILGVNNYPSSSGSVANQAAVRTALKTQYEGRGIPLLETEKQWGINSLTSSTLIRPDGIHLTDDSFTRIAGPSIAERAARLF